MTSYNRVILSGRVGRTPERRYRPDGSPVIQFPLEWSEEERPECPSRRGSETPCSGNPRKKGKSLINVVATGKLAEFDLGLLQIGQPLLVVGRLNQRRWQTPEGQSRTQIEVIATGFRAANESEQTGDEVLRPRSTQPDGRKAQTGKASGEGRDPVKNERREE